MSPLFDSNGKSSYSDYTANSCEGRGPTNRSAFVTCHTGIGLKAEELVTKSLKHFTMCGRKSVPLTSDHDMIKFATSRLIAVT